MMQHYTIRRSTIGDIAEVMTLYDYSRQLMRKSGNKSQWVGGYPSEALIRQDIALGDSYVVVDEDLIVGVFAFIIGRDPTYELVSGGEWNDDARPYGTIHRMARREGVHGIFSAIVEWCRRQIRSLRIDTHEENGIMRHLIEKHGFAYRGIIHVADGTPRRAYQMELTGVMCEPLREYIERTILPRYESFDSAHRRDHAETVIRNSMALGQHYDTDPNMVYTIAAYHDTGLCEGRERHHIVSRHILLADNELKRWFDDEELAVMGDAVEDHRASSGSAPRSLYGKIVAEADRDIDSLKIVRRTVQYGLAHYGALDKETQWRRTQQHLEEKYGEHGYLKLWIPESDNAERLSQLRALIADKPRLQKLFERIYAEESRGQKV